MTPTRLITPWEFVFPGPYAAIRMYRSTLRKTQGTVLCLAESEAGSAKDDAMHREPSPEFFASVLFSGPV